MKSEYNSLINNKTWILCDLPNERKPIGCKWLFKIKTNQNGEIERFKARLVAKGYSQKFGIDYDEIFAPVVRQSTFRILLSIATKFNLKVKQYDIETAFLNGTVQEDIYMIQPEPFISKGNEQKVCKLKRSLYGLKQAPRCWNDAINESLVTFGFKRCLSDQCLYYKKFSKNHWCLLLIYVDDILIAATNNDIFNETEKNISNIFTLKPLGPIGQFLGLQINNQNNSYTISQEKFINKIISKYGLEDAKPAVIPLDPSYHRNQENQQPLPSNEQYRSLIGSLLYIALNSRPHISTSVSILSQKITQPSQYDWDQLKQIVRYLRATIKLKLHINTTNIEQLEGYSDASWSESKIDGKSQSGYLFKLYGNLITWSSTKQKITAISSTESELCSLCEATKEVLWIKELLNEINLKPPEPIIIHEDNQSVIKMLKGNRTSTRTKHINTKYHFIYDYIENNTIQLNYCPTEHMPADMLTKPLNRIKLEKFRNELNIK